MRCVDDFRGLGVAYNEPAAIVLCLDWESKPVLASCDPSDGQIYIDLTLLYQELRSSP